MPDELDKMAARRNDRVGTQVTAEINLAENIHEDLDKRLERDRRKT